MYNIIFCYHIMNFFLLRKGYTPFRNSSHADGYAYQEEINSHVIPRDITITRDLVITSPLVITRDLIYTYTISLSSTTYTFIQAYHGSVTPATSAVLTSNFISLHIGACGNAALLT